MSVFQSQNYKKSIQARIAELKQQDRKYSFQNLARHCRIQKTYLSRVLNREKAHLSSDQLHLTLEFLGFGPDEKHYLVALHSFETSRITARRQALSAELSRIRELNLKTESHIQVPAAEIPLHDWHEYYLDPDAQLVHMFLCVPRFAADPRLIRKKLGLTEGAFAAVVQKLLDLGVIGGAPGASEKGKRGERGPGGPGAARVLQVLHVLKDTLHLPADSPLMKPYKMLLRQRALERIRRLEPGSGYGFSVIFAATEADRQAVQNEFLIFLKRAQKLVGRSRSERVFHMSFDLFEW